MRACERGRFDELDLVATYTYLDAEKIGSADISQLPGARLPRRPRNEVYVSASYLWWKKLRTTLSAKWVNAREELNFGATELRYRGLQLCEFCGRIRNQPASVRFRSHRQSDE